MSPGQQKHGQSIDVRAARGGDEVGRARADRGGDGHDPAAEVGLARTRWQRAPSPARCARGRSAAPRGARTAPRRSRRRCRGRRWPRPRRSKALVAVDFDAVGRQLLHQRLRHRQTKCLVHVLLSLFSGDLGLGGRASRLSSPWARPRSGRRSSPPRARRASHRRCCRRATRAPDQPTAYARRRSRGKSAPSARRPIPASALRPVRSGRARARRGSGDRVRAAVRRPVATDPGVSASSFHHSG